MTLANRMLEEKHRQVLEVLLIDLHDLELLEEDVREPVRIRFVCSRSQRPPRHRCLCAIVFGVALVALAARLRQYGRSLTTPGRRPRTAGIHLSDLICGRGGL
jgi:hypothetical protein